METAKVGAPVACANCGRASLAGAGIACIDDRDQPGRCGHCGGADAPPTIGVQVTVPDAPDAQVTVPDVA